MPEAIPNDLVPVIRQDGRMMRAWRTWAINKDNQLQGEASWTPTAALADAAVSSTTVTVTGAGLRDTALATHNKIGANNVLISAFVQAENTVRVVLMNKTGAPLTIAAGTVYVTVFRRQ